MTVRGMENAVPVLHIIGIMMKAFPAVSFPEKPRLPMIAVLRLCAATEASCLPHVRENRGVTYEQ